MINSFSCKETERIFFRTYSRKFPANLQTLMRKKLLMLHHAYCLDDLKSPPGNKLEKLIGNRKGQYSIRINQQWRICFKWNDGNIDDVCIVDYH